MDLVNAIKQVEHHRNGVTGESFWAVLFESGYWPGTFLGIVFEGPGRCAVVNVDRLAQHGVTFAENSWRGDDFEPELRAAIERANPAPPEVILWDPAAPVTGTAYRGLLYEAPWPFEETVARIQAASGQETAGDEKTTVEARGRFGDLVFTLYDYRGHRRIHIGGPPELTGERLARLREALLAELERAARKNGAPA